MNFHTIPPSLEILDILEKLKLEIEAAKSDEELLDIYISLSKVGRVSKHLKETILNLLSEENLGDRTPKKEVASSDASAVSATSHGEGFAGEVGSYLAGKKIPAAKIRVAMPGERRPGETMSLLDQLVDGIFGKKITDTKEQK